jgi:hypothetical protein
MASVSSANRKLSQHLVVAIKKPHVHKRTSGLENPELRSRSRAVNKLIFFVRLSVSSLRQIAAKLRVGDGTVRLRPRDVLPCSHRVCLHLQMIPSKRKNAFNGTDGTPRRPHAVLRDIFLGVSRISSVTIRASFPSPRSRTASASR